MSLLDFRNAMLVKLSSRLNTVDIANAKDTELLIYGAMLKHLDAATKIDVISLDGLKLIETMSAADLDQYALDPSSRLQVVTLLKDSLTLQIIAQSPALLTAISSSQQWMTLVDSSSTAVSTFATSATAMATLTVNATARAKIGPNLLAAIKSATMPYAKYLAGCAGLNPTDYASLDELNTNVTLAKLVETPASQSQIGTTGLAFETFKANSVFCGKLLAAALNLTVTSFADMVAFAANTAAVNSLFANTGAFSLFLNMPKAIADLMANYSARALLWNSETARTSMVGNTTVRNQLLTMASLCYSNSGNYSTGVTKKVWLISINNNSAYNSGEISYGYISSGGTVNNATATVNASTMTGANNPYFVPVHTAKAAGLVLNNTTPGLLLLNYIQMEA